MYRPLFRLLFNFGFLGCRLSGAESEVYVYDSPEFTESLTNLSSTAEFYIHPAFRSALEAHEFVDARYVDVGRFE